MGVALSEVRHAVGAEENTMRLAAGFRTVPQERRPCRNRAQSAGKSGKIGQAGAGLQSYVPRAAIQAGHEPTNEKVKGSTMKTILATLLGISVLAGFATQSSAASLLPSAPHAPTLAVPAADYDDPAFGSRGWWEQQEDRGG